MKGRLTTHVLDLSQGRPAAGVKVRLRRLADDEAEGPPGLLLAEAETNADGRLEEPLLADGGLERGVYELTFDANDYFCRAADGKDSNNKPIFGSVPVRFRVDDPDAHYHIPLLVAPGGYSTYRGS
ncbi:hydroxyisourate hydrolase [Cohnella rhizosphaerae]|uniref:5-hydroxyisourate hydrolase n=1 Tax=Cohnella rhizosphaerae TaxID=1457232 RepID=A0A9X4KWW5_9BACL|nr:hydroxyisourate hydrolase [Cohnella rhizosphaerae]MDG0812781.1 hydroxyisourate hydrolase [Cohnella rhizosphaerae]